MPRNAQAALHHQPIHFGGETMYSHGTSHGSPSSGGPGHLSSCPADLNSHFVGLATNCPLHVLSVGRIEAGALIRDSLIDSAHFTVTFVNDYRDLWIFSKQHAVDTVVMQNALCSFELADAARLARGRWPQAKILIIRSGELSLERRLYDQHLHPPVNQETLVEGIFRLSKSSREGE
jgi:hypothetical protein